MKCIKCLEKVEGTSKDLNLPDMLSHFKKWTICSSCNDKLKEKRDSYKKHNKYYKKKQKEYRETLADQYVSRVICDNTVLKPKEIPKNLIQAKRQHMQLNKILKEDR